MKVVIKGKVVTAEFLERGSLDTRRGKHLRPIKVRYNGQDLWVYDDEGDGRVVPGDHGPARIGRDGPYYC